MSLDQPNKPLETPESETTAAVSDWIRLSSSTRSRFDFMNVKEEIHQQFYLPPRKLSLRGKFLDQTCPTSKCCIIIISILVSLHWFLHKFIVSVKVCMSQSNYSGQKVGRWVGWFHIFTRLCLWQPWCATVRIPEIRPLPLPLPPQRISKNVFIFINCSLLSGIFMMTF